jgi:hypothetical protein
MQNGQSESNSCSWPCRKGQCYQADYKSSPFCSVCPVVCSHFASCAALSTSAQIYLPPESNRKSTVCESGFKHFASSGYKVDYHSAMLSSRKAFSLRWPGSRSYSSFVLKSPRNFLRPLTKHIEPNWFFPVVHLKQSILSRA